MLSDAEYNEIVAHSYDSKKLMEYLDNKNGSKLVQRISGDSVDEEIVIEDNRFGKYTDYIRFFVTKFNKVFSDYNNSALVNNLRTLVIEEVDELESPDALALYDKSTNKILVKRGYSNEEDLKHYLFHELLHMASTYKREPIYISGFAQTVLPGYGTGSTINEGVTELIERRYFSTYLSGNAQLIYGYEKNMVFLLEAIVTTPKLYEYYFNGDLLGLVNELSLYCGKSLANKVLVMFGMFNSLTGSDRQALYIDIKDLLRRIYLKKCMDRLNNEEIEYDDLEFFKLKASLNVRGYNINKKQDGSFRFFDINSNIIHDITPDMYRILMEYYKSTNENMGFGTKLNCVDFNLIELCYSLFYLNRSGYDMSKIESVRVNDFDKRDLDITYRLEDTLEIDDEEDILAAYNSIKM